jgi:thymidylate synthase
MDKVNVFFIYSDPINERFINQLINQRKFCISCGQLCDDCRIPYGSFSGDISGVHYIPENLPEFIDEPNQYLPESIPNTDVVVAINIHQDLLSALPLLLSTNNIKGLIVPIENGSWVPLGLQRQIEEELKKFNIQSAFPRPYCSLESNGQPIIENFIKYFRIGKPKIKLRLMDDQILEGEVEISSPCGCAWYLIRELVRYKPKIKEDLKEVISKAHHSYPCNAAMIEDKALGDAPLHIGGYIHRECVYRAIVNVVGYRFDFITHELPELALKTKIKY